MGAQNVGFPIDHKQLGLFCGTHIFSDTSSVGYCNCTQVLVMSHIIWLIIIIHHVTQHDDSTHQGLGICDQFSRKSEKSLAEL